MRVCVCMHLFTLVILSTAWAGGARVAASPQPPDARLEVMAVTFSQTCPWEPATLSEQESSRTLAGTLAPAPPHPDPEPFLPLSSHQTDEQEDDIAGFCPEHGILEAARALLSSCFMTQEAGPAAGDRCSPDTVTWSGFFLILKFPATGSSRALLGHLGLNLRL